MPRSTSGKIHRLRRKKVLKDVKGFFGARSKQYHTAKDARRRALQNSYIHRRDKKNDFRALWIVRINAAARMCGISYSRLISGMHKTGIIINRKMLADLAVNDFSTFQKIVSNIKQIPA
jgi:large subunit ribosomal protein L20